MSSWPTPSDPADRAAQREERTQRYLQALDELVDMGMDLARAVHAQGTQALVAEPAAPASDLGKHTAAFGHLTRTVRRTMALAHKLSEPDRAPAQAKQADQAERRSDHGAPRRVHLTKPLSKMTDAELEALEPDERLDDREDPDGEKNPDDEGESDDDLIVYTCRELGVTDLPDSHPWSRVLRRQNAQESAQGHMPADEPDPHARAAQRSPEAVPPADQGSDPRQPPALQPLGTPQGAQHGTTPGTGPP